jgi:hypothetical protein
MGLEKCMARYSLAFFYFHADSIMVKMKLPEGKNQDDINDHFEVAKWLASEITKEYQAPNDLEFEVSLQEGRIPNTVYHSSAKYAMANLCSPFP